MTTLDNWRNIPCILVVDLENPKEHHDLHNDYPLAPQRLMIKKVEVPTFYSRFVDKGYILLKVPFSMRIVKTIFEVFTPLLSQLDILITTIKKPTTT